MRHGHAAGPDSIVRGIIHAFQRRPWPHSSSLSSDTSYTLTARTATEPTFGIGDMFPRVGDKPQGVQVRQAVV